MNHVGTKINKDGSTALAFQGFWRMNRYALLGALLGVLVFVLLYGVRVLNPTEVGWLLDGGDPSQHYLGWQFYRESPVRLPFLGMSYNTVYPHRISVSYTDSLPLFALLFKLLGPLLPVHFQYFGIWGLLCFVLQGFYGYKLIARLGRAEQGTPAQCFAVLCGTGAVLLYPALLLRMFGHTALAGNWLILAALWLWLDEARANRTTRQACLIWGLMGFLGAGLHLYYLPMMGMVLVGYSICRGIRIKKWYAFAAPVAAYCGCALALLAVLGAFSGNFSGTANYYLYGADVLGLLLPWLPENLEHNVFAGYGTLLAFMLTIALAIWYLVRHGDAKGFFHRHKAKLISAVTIAVLSIVTSVSNTVEVGGIHVGVIPIPQLLMRVWSMFSSNGRLAWVAGYLLLVCCCGGVLRMGKRAAPILLAACFVAQGVGQLPLLQTRYSNYHNAQSYEMPSLGEQESWQALADSGLIDHLSFAGMDLDDPNYWALETLATEQNWTSNVFYLGHMDGILLNETSHGQLAELQPRTLYAFLGGDEFAASGCALNFYRVDGILLGSLEELPLESVGLPSQMQLQVDLNRMSFEENATSAREKNGPVLLAGGESVAGPGWYMPAGQYQVEITGEGFDHSYVFSGWQQGRDPYQKLNIVFLNSSAQSISFQFTTYEPLYNWQTAVHTLDEREIRIDGITVTKTA